jgi:RNA polymerase sigma factor (TIGR02999 family)
MCKKPVKDRPQAALSAPPTINKAPAHALLNIGGHMQTLIESAQEQCEHRDTAAPDVLFCALYRDLHRIAPRELARQGGHMTLSPTTLLHRAYINVVERSAVDFPDTSAFVGYAARVMRGLVIDHARRRRALKRGGHFVLVPLEADLPESPVDDREFFRVGEALDDLAGTDPELAQVVELKFFCGLSFAQIAAIRTVSERTVQRNWEKARIYLHPSIRRASNS